MNLPSGEGQYFEVNKIGIGTPDTSEIQSKTVINF